MVLEEHAIRAHCRRPFSAHGDERTLEHVPSAVRELRRGALLSHVADPERRGRAHGENVREASSHSSSWRRRQRKWSCQRSLIKSSSRQDVSMIQEAHVGFGLMGKEGRQAVNSCDFALGKFKFVRRVLLVHGNLFYNRVTMLIHYFFYKVHEACRKSKCSLTGSLRRT